MKTVILAGGRGTRIAEETSTRPKPMIEIGGQPVLCHTMRHYAHYGCNDFLIACGYKGEVIKQYFHDFVVNHSDFVIDLATGARTILNASAPDWRVGVVDTGLETMTGGRIRRLAPHLGAEPFMVSYGDTVSNVDIDALLRFHRSHGRLATVTAVRPPARFGGLSLDGPQVTEFTEKPQAGEGWINGGYFVFEPGVMQYLHADDTILERDPLERLSAEGQLMAYRHTGFWHAMDTLRDKLLLESLWASGAPWRVGS